MGTMTLSEMRTEVRFMLDNRRAASGGGPSDDQLDRYINWAYNHVSRPSIYRHRELQDTQDLTMVNGTASYALTTVPMAIYDVYNSTDEYRLEPRDIRLLDDRVATSGRPSLYAVWGNTVQVSPTPGSDDAGDTVVVRYWKAPTVLSADGDTTDIRYEWDEVICFGAAWRGWAALNQHARALAMREEFGTKIMEVQDIAKVEGEDPGNVWEVSLPSYQRGTY